MPEVTGNAAALIAIVIALAQFIGKAIPDDATGALGLLRKVAKVIGLYITNQKT